MGGPVCPPAKGQNNRRGGAVYLPGKGQRIVGLNPGAIGRGVGKKGSLNDKKTKNTHKQQQKDDLAQ